MIIEFLSPSQEVLRLLENLWEKRDLLPYGAQVLLIRHLVAYRSTKKISLLPRPSWFDKSEFEWETLTTRKEHIPISSARHFIWRSQILLKKAEIEKEEYLASVRYSISFLNKVASSDQKLYQLQQQYNEVLYPLEPLPLFLQARQAFELKKNCFNIVLDRSKKEVKKFYANSSDFEGYDQVWILTMMKFFNLEIAWEKFPHLSHTLIMQRAELIGLYEILAHLVRIEELSTSFSKIA